PYVIIGVILAVALWLLYEFWKRRRVTGDPKEVPIIGEKLIKPADKEPSPDSVSLHTNPKKEAATPKSTKPANSNQLLMIAVITAIGLLVTYHLTKRRR